MEQQFQKKQKLYKADKTSADVIVIGAGAAGLMSAIAAAHSGASVLVVEHTSVSGKKLLSTGNGRCNFTNAMQNTDCYHSDDPELVMSALRRFSEKTRFPFLRTLASTLCQNTGIITRAADRPPQSAMLCFLSQNAVISAFYSRRK